MASKGLRVVVALSGGVDSSVAALLLARYAPPWVHVVGAAHMTNWTAESEIRGDTATPAVCSAEKDAAAQLAASLELPFHHCTFEPQFYNCVFKPMVEAQRRGSSWNPDCECNRLIKFDAFATHALRRFDADCIATGHYARNQLWRLSAELARRVSDADSTSSGDKAGFNEEALALPGIGRLYRPLAASTNDQSYFLSRVGAAAFQRALFPNSELTKKQVRNIASAHGLAAATKTTSTGICFIGKRTFSDFVAEHAEALSSGEDDMRLFSPGAIRWASGLHATSPLRGTLFTHGDASPHTKVTAAPPIHQGVARYTIGQKVWVSAADGLQAVYVAEKCSRTNELGVVPTWDHPLLFRCAVTLRDMVWHAPAASDGVRLLAVLRHLAPPEPVSVSIGSSEVRLVFDRPVRAPTGGQVAALYDPTDTAGGVASPGELCVGAGIIVE
jgi:tRNA U34 2-thiouridine synthase MnmA/TrmU